jgi:hypothetical protein
MHMRITYKASQISQVSDLWLRKYALKSVFFLNAGSYEFFCFKDFFVEIFFMCPQPSFQTYYELTQVVRHIHFT